MTTPEKSSLDPNVMPSHILDREVVQEQSRNIERAERLHIYVQRLGETGLLKAQMELEVDSSESDERLADRLGS